MLSKKDKKVFSLMNIALCDDNPAFLQLLKMQLDTYWARYDWVVNCDCYQSADALLKSNLERYQVIFLDVDMPSLNGLEAAGIIRRRCPDLLIVFITAFIEYAPAGYCVDAFRYLLKTDLEAELPLCLSAIWERLYVSQESIEIQLPDRTWHIRLKDILYFEGTSQRHVLLHSLASSKKLECLGKLSAFETQLSAKGFLRIQRSYLVNMLHIEQINNYHAILSNHERLKVSELNYPSICRTYALWKGHQI